MTEKTPKKELSGSDNLSEYTVSELSFAVKKRVEDAFGYVRVRGELGRVSRPASGHVYLDLKDEQAVLSGIIWKSAVNKLDVKPEQGLEVICSGRLTTYPGQSRYQIVIESMSHAGAGALMALMEERRRKLAAEGLFDEMRKKPLPFLPKVIGVVTSPTGAVIRDILHRLQDRFPVHVLVWPARVQGAQAAEEVVTAIEGFNRLGVDDAVARPDLLIIARGGGSLEDLWPFSEEAVVRAVAASEIPVISAIGHETDTMLIDFASDRRAPTPSAAAEIATPVRADLMGSLLSVVRRQAQAVERFVTGCQNQMHGVVRGLPHRSALLALPSQRLDGAVGRLPTGLGRHVMAKTASLAGPAGRLGRHLVTASLKSGGHRVATVDKTLTGHLATSLRYKGQQMQGAAERLRLLSYEATLERGYALVRGAEGRLVRRAQEISLGEALSLEFTGHEQVTVRVEDAPKSAKSSPKRRRTSRTLSQGTLFDDTG